jgi:hypothetical protein
METICKHCGKVLEQVKVPSRCYGWAGSGKPGRIREYCSDRCRKAAQRQRKSNQVNS